MRYVQLRAFHNVAIHGGFSRAAEALHLSQPAISDQVRKLETEYDIVLFNRHKKQVKVTRQGQQLLEITQRLFENESQARELLSETRAFSQGTLRIIADSTRHVLDILSAFRKKYPGIHVSIRSGNTEDVISALYSFDADIGVLGGAPKNTDVEVLHLQSTPIVAFASEAFDLDARAPVPLAKLATYPLVLREPGSKTRQKLDELARQQGLKLKPAIEAEGREAVREIVASGVGIGFVSEAEFGRDDRLRAITIEGPPVLMDEALVSLRERSGGKLIRAFMSLAAEMAEPD